MAPLVVDGPPLWISLQPAIFRSAPDLIKRPNILASVLPGIGGSILAGTSRQVLQHFAHTTSSSSTLNIGALSPQAGDFCLIVTHCGNSSNTVPTAVTPSGFSVIIDNGFNHGGTHASRMMAVAKVLTGSETTVSTMTGTQGRTSHIYIFRPTIPFASFASNDVDSEYTDGNPAADTVTVTGAGSYPVLVIGIAACYESSFTTFVTDSPAFDAEDIVATSFLSGRLLIGYKVYNQGTALSDHTVDHADTDQGNFLGTFYVTFT